MQRGAGKTGANAPAAVPSPRAGKGGSVMNIRDVISPTAILYAKILGYGVFVVGGAVVVLAGLRIRAEARAAYNRYRRGQW